MLYQIAFSFAGEDRKYVSQVAEELRKREIKIFYDEYETVALWGKDLYQHLSKVYSEMAEFTIIFISAHYEKKLWTNHELRSAQARAFKDSQEYILPVRFDETNIPGILNTVGYLDLKRYTPIQLADFIIEKLFKKSSTSEQPKSEPQKMTQSVERESFAFAPIKKFYKDSGSDTNIVLSKQQVFGQKIHTFSKDFASSFFGYLNDEAYLAVKSDNGKFGFIDRFGKVIIPFKYDHISYMRGNLAAVKLGDKWGMIDSNGKLKLHFEYDYLSSPTSSEQIILFKIDNLIGVYDLELKEVFTRKIKKNWNEEDMLHYLYILLSKNGFGKNYSNDNHPVIKSNTGNEECFFYPLTILDIYNSDKIYTVNKKFRRLPFASEKQLSKVARNGLYGFIDEDVNFVYDCIFTEVTDFFYDRALVRFNDKTLDEWVMIDNFGNILVKNIL